MALTRTYRSLPPKHTFTITSAEYKTDTLVGDNNDMNNISQSQHENTTNGKCRTPVVYGKNSPFTALLEQCKRVTSADHFQDVRLVTLDISGSGIEYKPGDVVWIYPE